MKQQSLASQSVFEKYGRKSRRELFLDEMEQVVRKRGFLAVLTLDGFCMGKDRMCPRSIQVGTTGHRKCVLQVFGVFTSST